MLLARAFGPKWDIIARKIWIHGQNAGVSSPSQHRPHSTRTFSSSARSASFPTRRVFPMPASPPRPRKTTPSCPTISATKPGASSGILHRRLRRSALSTPPRTTLPRFSRRPIRLLPGKRGAWGARGDRPVRRARRPPSTGASHTSSWATKSTRSPCRGGDTEVGVITSAQHPRTLAAPIICS